MLDGETVTNAHVKVPLKTMNRHGLIAGATGTGKTKTLQVIAENLSIQKLMNVTKKLEYPLTQRNFL